MLTDYIAEAMARASYKILEDGTYFGEIPSLHGVWSNEATLEECRKVLQEVLEEWLLLKLRDDEIPPLSERLFAKQG
jgi:predicted RNase H-like HicB family nuclease